MPSGWRRGWLAGSLIIALLVASCGSGAEPALDEEAAAAVLETAEPLGVSLAAAWTANAMPLRGNEGKQYSIVCPPALVPRTIWGTDVYSDDSSICTAAVHFGVIDMASGGQVVFEVRPGESRYRGSDRNGIQSWDWTTSWDGSFVIIGAAPLTAAQAEAASSEGELPTADDLVEDLLEDLFDSLYGDD